MAYSNGIGTMLPSSVPSVMLLSASVLMAIACGPAEPARPRSTAMPVSPAASAERADRQPEDLRVVLEEIRLGASSAAGAMSMTPTGHDGRNLAEVVFSHAADMQGCAARAQPAASAESNRLQLFLEIDAQGAVLGGSTQPSPGQEGMSAVADCVLEAARSWLFPSRQRRGRTILIVPFVVAN